MKRIYLLLLFIAFSVFVKAANIYWVGGDGNWNDPVHWSTTSGGASAGLVPTINDNVIFDESSGPGQWTVHIGTNAECHNLNVTENFLRINFSSSAGSHLRVDGSFVINAGVSFDNGCKVSFTSAQANNVVETAGQKVGFKAHFTGSGSWKLMGMNGSSQMDIEQSSGTLLLDHVSIACNSFRSAGGSIEADGSFIKAPAHFEISAQTTVNISTKLFVSATINDPSAYKVPASVPASKLSVQNSSAACVITYVSTVFSNCSNNCSGTVTITLAGCVSGPYQADWYLGGVPQFTVTGINSSPYVQSNLCCSSNSYSVLFFDASSNFVTAITVPVTCPGPPNIFPTLVSTKCNDTCDGKIILQIFDPYPSYTVNYSPAVTGYPKSGVVLRDTAANLCAGSYVLTVTNSIGCVSTQTLTVTEPAAIAANGSSTNVNCNSVCDGTATVAPTGGNGSYVYSWASPPGFSTAASVSALCPGTYTCTITDSRGCPGSYTATITQPTALSFSTSQVNPVCGDVCNGTATISGVAGGTSPYTFSWLPGGTASSSGATSSTATGLCPGSSYTVTVTDAQGCDTTFVYSITGPAAVTGSVTTNDVDCFGQTNGSATGSAAGGTSPYSFAWYNSGGTQISTANPTVNNLGAGTYSLVVTAQLGCDDTVTFTITEPAALTASATSSSASCAGVCDGAITTTVSGGTTAYGFSWTGGLGTSQNPSGVCDGSYTVTVTDANSCTVTATVTVTEPTPIAFTQTITNPSCNGASDGIVNVTASGGSGSVTLVWADCGACPMPRTGMAAGTYSVIATDGSACQDTLVFTLTEPNALSVTLSPTTLSCAGACDATISGTISGGTPTYTYQWDGNAALTSPILSAACAGTHTLAVTDANGCVTTQTSTLVDPLPISITLTTVDPDCNGQCTGTASSLVSGGTAPYDYSWATGGQITTAINNLCAGTYTLTVTDANNCSNTAVATINEPAIFAVSTGSVNPDCAGNCNGSAGIVASGGTPGYTYSWNTGSTNDTITGQCAGNYNVTATDANGCTANASFTLTQPTALSVSVSNIVNTCASTCNGAATATGNGGTPSYSFTWAPGGETGSNPTTLCTGAGTVTVTDANGCTSTATYTITAPLAAVITTTSNSLTCFGDCNGIATAVVSGANNPISYLWTSPAPTSPATQSSATATNLCSGTHSLTVTDGNGCTTSTTVTFTDPAVLTSSISSVNLSCFDVCTGSATVTGGGGTGTLDVLWMPGNLSTTTISNLCAGTYTVTITDDNSCTKIDSVTITEPADIITASAPTNPSTCSAADGCITLTPSGGSGTYNYAWNPPAGQTTATVCGLASGIYQCVVTDLNGCDDTVVVALSDPTGPTFTVTSTNASCFGLCDGSGTVNASGTNPITITWPASAGGVVGATASGLCDGTYNVDVTDGVGCTVFATVTITEPAQITDAAATITHPSCASACDGSIDPAISGGTGAYTYSWAPSGSGAPSTNMCAGTYTLTVTDANGCSVAMSPYTLTAPTGLSLSFTQTNITCPGLCTGAANATPSGGTNPVSYAWSGPSGYTGVTQNISGLCAGVYTLTVTDGNGCTLTDSVTITEPVALTTGLSTTNTLCNGDCNGTATMNPSGGTSPYTFSWTAPNGTAATVSNLCAGNYTATVTDANLCTDTTHFTITQPQPLAVSFTSTAPTCFGTCTGTANANVTGGTASYNYTWNPVVAVTANAVNLCAGTYTVDVADANGCTVTGNFTLVPPSVLLGSVTSTPPSCSAPCSGIISSAPVGGTPSYTTTVSPGGSLTNLCAGTYTAYVTDANGCVDSTVVSISAPPPLTITSATAPSDCSVPCIGAISVSATSGTAPISYLWISGSIAGSTSQTPTGLCAGIYDLQVTDGGACVDTFSIAVSDANGPDSATILTSGTSCIGVCDGQAIITQVFNGTPGYTYLWNTTPSSSNDTVSGLCGGNYLVTITDANNCLFIPTVVIDEPDAIDDVETITQATCNGLCDGAISVAPTGGTAPYSYAWTSSTGFTSTSQNVSSLCAGTYSLTITDANGCTGSFSYTVGNNSAINATVFSANTSCNAVCDGSGFINSISGGTLPYDIAWSDPLGQSALNATGLCAGNYSVTVTDGIGCTQTFTVAVTEPAAVVPNETVTDATCGVCNGQVVLNPTGGSGTYTYVWSNAQTSSTATSLCAGVYMVDITDGVGCVSQHSVAVSNANGPSITVTPTNIACATSACTGAASASVTGGTAPYTINWVPGGSGSTVSSLCPGTYFVQAQDAANCITTQSFTITAADTLVLAQQSVQPDCGVCNGTLIAAASGGTAPYSYSWNTGATNDTITSVCAGSYTLTVTDAGGCSLQQIYSLSNVNAPAITLTTDSANCNGNADGAASVSISGGTPGYTTTWSAGTAAGTSVSALGAGNYSVNVSDAAGCIATASFTIDEPNPLALSLNATTLPSCTGVCNGAMTAVPSGGTLGYSYLWATGSTASSVSNLCAGSYSVIVTDAHGCSTSQNTTLINNPSLINGNPTVVNPACGLCDGSISLAPTGGQSPYTYNWNTGATGTNITNVCAGVYQVNITDANGCVTPFNVNVSNTNGPTVTTSATDETCFGLCDGSASASIAAGTGPYQIFWVSGGQTTTSISGQCPGTYTVQVQDVNNCVTTAPVTINAAAQIFPNFSITVPSCGNSNGGITLNPTGGSGSGYTYNWCCGLGNSSSVNGIGAGSYSVTITDGNGCVEPVIVPVSNGTIPLVTVAVDSVTCYGLATGSATVTITGGSGPFTTTWSTGTPSGTSVSGLGAGIYSVVVTDNASGCISSTAFTILEPDTLSLSLNSQQQPSCAIACNGALTAIPSGGTMPYSYLWSPSSLTSMSINSLCAGSYSVTVTDANGCARSQTTILNNNQNLISSAPAITQPGCNQCNGAITLNPSGGNLPYASFNWSNGATTQDISSVCAGLYQVLVTDALGCSQTLNLNVSSANGITGDTQTITDETCFNVCDGSATVNPVGGTAPYTFSWIGSTVTSNSQSNLCAGTYFMQTTDANGCIYTSQVVITSPNQMLITPTVADPSCGLSDGSISLSISGGTLPYSYLWVPVGNNTPMNTNLAAGNYSVTVGDANGCTQVVSVSLSTVNAPTVSGVATNPGCGGTCDGEIALTISGGNPGYTILWNNASTNDTITGLCDTVYSVTVTDAAGCVASSTFTLTEPTPLQFSLANLTDPLCNGSSDGTITTIPSGGTLPFTFSWSPPASSTTSSASGLPAGVYTVTITDVNGCTATENDTLTDPPLLSLAGVVTDATCSTVPDGAIDLTVTGGTPGYTYQWSNSGTTEDLTNILAGSYTVVVADTNACSDTLSFTVIATVVVDAVVNNDTTLCSGGSILLDGSASTGGLTYQWTDLQTGAVISTNDTVTVTPSVSGLNSYLFITTNGACADTDTVVINNIALPVVDAGPYTTILIFNSATIGGNPTGPSGSIFDWTPGATLSDSTIANPIASPTVTTTYTVTVTNSNGCTSSDTVTVRVLPQITFPNGFTPNNDGKNDVWVIDNISLFPECEVEVYNRWGERLFYSRGYTTPWDGTYKNKPLPVGTYYYAIKLNHPFFPEPFVGPITILR